LNLALAAEKIHLSTAGTPKKFLNRMNAPDYCLLFMAVPAADAGFRPARDAGGG
jgi:hypothetical protein